MPSRAGREGTDLEVGGVGCEARVRGTPEQGHGDDHVVDRAELAAPLRLRGCAIAKEQKLGSSAAGFYRPETNTPAGRALAGRLPVSQCRAVPNGE